MKHNIIYIILLILALVIISSLAIPHSHAEEKFQSEIMELFFRANKIYQDAEISKDLKEKTVLFQKSAEIYEQIVKSGFASGPLYYNLANAYLRLGKKGKAIANYLKAQALMPRNEDVKSNLQYAREHLQVSESGLPDTLKSLLFFHYSTTLNEEAWLLIIAYLICVSFIIIYIFWRYRIIKWVYLISGIITLCLMVSVAIRIYESQIIHKGIVIAKSQVRSTPSQEMPAIIEIPEGTDVIIQEEKGKWFKIFFGKDQKGWVPGSDIEQIL